MQCNLLHVENSEPVVCVQGQKHTHLNCSILASVYENVQKFLLTCVYCTKYNEINLLYSCVRKHASLKNSMNISYIGSD